MRVLVTGAAGYIGSHVCKALAARGDEPVAYDNLSRGRLEAIKWGPFEQGDIADISRLQNVISRYQPVAVMHFAAYTYVGESVADPLLYYRNNVAGSASLIEAVLRERRIPIIFSSTAAVYGTPNSIPIPEDSLAAPLNPYGFSKYAVERMLADADAAYGLKSARLRYFNAAGADPDGEIGENHDPETHLIPLVLAAVRDGTPVRIFGNDYGTPDGTCIRDYIHVLDIAAAHLSALDYLLAGNASCTCNLANSRGYSVKEVIAAAERVCGKPVPTEIGPRRAGDPAVLVGETARARDLLKWTPQRSDLATQISDAWRWMTGPTGRTR